MVNAGAADGAVSAADILKPYLARGNIKVIGATTINEYNKYFLKDKALTRRFEKIVIDEPSLEETKQILYNVKKEYEKYHNIKITSKNIEDIVKYANIYIHDKCNPDKSIELLDSICAKVKLKERRTIYLNDNIDKLNTILEKKKIYIKNNEFDKAIKCKTIENNLKEDLHLHNNDSRNKITSEDILNVIEEKTKIPLVNINEEKEISNKLSKKLVGQENAINQIKLCLNNNENKVKSMLFYGTSGIGKTMAAKIIGENYNLIKLDMAEYSKETSISKLIGVEPGYSGYDTSYIFEQIREKPHSLIILDEIEKAHPKVLNLFLNILEDGSLLDSHNELVNFNNCLIIATGNMKAKKTLGFGKSKNNFEDILPKELISRFNQLIEFKTLEYNDIYKYIKSNYNFNEEIIKNIILESDYVNYGLRNINNLINEKLCKVNS